MSYKGLDANIIVETLKRSNLKTVLIEGVDDIEVYRNIEDSLDIEDISFLECGGRSNLLQVYDRKGEIQDKKLLFLCDSDTWVFFGIPEEYKGDDLLTTKGYSIENDLYSDGEDILKNLLRKNEKIKFSNIMLNVCRWYAHEISKLIEDSSHECNFADVKLLSTTKMKRNSVNLEESFLESRGFIEPDEGLLNDIVDNAHNKLRGKYIFQAFEKIFQERVKKDITYTRSQLFDIVIKTVIGQNLEDKELVKKRQYIENFLS